MVVHPRSNQACASAADELSASGCATLIMDGRQEGIIRELYEAAGTFFGQSEGDRRSAMLPWSCGYVPFGQEHSGDPAKPDQVDFFVYSPRVRPLIGEAVGAPARGLLDAMIPAFDELELLAEAIAMQVASRMAGIDASERLRGGFRRWSLLEVHQARPVGCGDLINEPHEDGVVLTLAHANAPGLEIEVDGAFMPPARTAPGMIAMPGSAITLLTGGAIPPLRHRVRAGPPARPRLSVLFFAALEPRRCTPWLATPLNAGVDIGAHVAGNSMRFGIAGFEPE